MWSIKVLSFLFWSDCLINSHAFIHSYQLLVSQTSNRLIGEKWHEVMIYTTWSESTVSTSYYIKLKPIPHWSRYGINQVHDVFVNLFNLCNSNILSNQTKTNVKHMLSFLDWSIDSLFVLVHICSHNIYQISITMFYKVIMVSILGNKQVLVIINTI